MGVKEEEPAGTWVSILIPLNPGTTPATVVFLSLLSDLQAQCSFLHRAISLINCCTHSSGSKVSGRGCPFDGVQNSTSSIARVPPKATVNMAPGTFLFIDILPEGLLSVQVHVEKICKTILQP